MVWFLGSIILWLGAEVRSANGWYGTVQEIQFILHPQPMYDLTVAEAHTFFVGDGQWLVHNCGNAFPKTWGQMTQTERAAFQHAYDRHGKQFGLPNWSETQADNRIRLFNQAVANVRINAQSVSVSRELYNGQKVWVEHYIANPSDL